MKKLLIGAVMASLCFCANGYASHYTMDGVVTETYGETVVVEDSRGEIWDFNGTGYYEGQEVKLTFDNNGSDENIYDDMIVNAK